MPRGLVAKTLRRILEGSPELIGLDMLLSEKRTPEEDKDLEAALRDAGNVILASQLGSGQLPVANPLPEFCQPEAYPRNISYCQPGGAFGYASINMPVDDDGFIRRMYPLLTRDASMLSVPVALETSSKSTRITPSRGGGYPRRSPGGRIPIVPNRPSATIAQWRSPRDTAPRSARR